MTDIINFDCLLSDQVFILETTGILHAVDCNRPWVSFTLPAEASSYFAPTEYSIVVPPTIQWPFMSYGEFAVDLTVTLNADTLEVVALDDIRPNPKLSGGF